MSLISRWKRVFIEWKSIRNCGLTLPDGEKVGVMVISKVKKRYPYSSTRTRDDRILWMLSHEQIPEDLLLLQPDLLSVGHEEQ
jgi:hypothetical protein